MDILLAAATLVLAMPVIGLVALAIWVTMGRPIFYLQPRLGRHGIPFRCFKFRTMVTNGDEVLRRHLVNDAAAALEWRETCKLARDPRVTRLGYLLRKSSLDELPQLVNILRGDMSCVGPRPIALGELERYGPHAREYLRMRPGLTGLWQTSGRSKLSYQDRVALDVHYANNRTLLLDISIILKTVPAVLNFDQSA
jgi:exopolysaccharide production protein ExoY